MLLDGLGTSEISFCDRAGDTDTVALTEGLAELLGGTLDVGDTDAKEEDDGSDVEDRVTLGEADGETGEAVVEGVADADDEAVGDGVVDGESGPISS